MSLLLLLTGKTPAGRVISDMFQVRKRNIFLRQKDADQKIQHDNTEFIKSTKTFLNKISFYINKLANNLRCLEPSG